MAGSARAEHARMMLRSARGLITGTPIAVARRTAPAVDRSLRAAVELERPGPAEDPLSSDPAERMAVLAGWQLVNAYERLSTDAARRVFGGELRAWVDYARQSVPKLEPWGRPEAMRLHETDESVLRYRRTMDFVRQGERVFDVGFGFGVLAALIMRERKLAGYHGIDVVDWHPKVARQTLAINGFADADIDLRAADLYDLTRDQIVAAGASFVICCEVLEHVPDPERALRTLADALPDGAELLFSVPLFGRLEAVWGHLSVFDTARLKAMLDSAGLIAHHVEPVANTWTFVVASRSGAASQRVREAAGRPAANVSRPLSLRRDFLDVGADEFTADDGADVVRKDRHMVTVVVPAGDQATALEFPVRGFEAARLQLNFVDFEQVQRVRVCALSGDRISGEWTWHPKPRQVVGGTSRRFALRPGESGSAFRSVAAGDLTQSDRVRVDVEVAPGGQAKFRLRAAYLPARS